MNLRTKVTHNTLYRKYVDVLNGVLQLSKRVAEVLVLILQVDASVDKYVTEGEARQLIRHTLGISESNLSVYLKALKDKYILIKGEGNHWVLNDNLRPRLVGNIMEITFTLEVTNGEDKVNKVADYESTTKTEASQ